LACIGFLYGVTVKICDVVIVPPFLVTIEIGPLLAPDGTVALR
jgi:hypothetical protein